MSPQAVGPISPIDTAIGRLKAAYTPGPGRPSEDPEPDLRDDSEDIELPEHLLWPPPGLEHSHGLLPRLTVEFWFAACIMMTPVALAQLRARPPEIGSWGTVVVMIVVGVLLWGSYMRLLVLFNRATSAVRAGYPRQLVWHVAADWARDTPQILRGQASFERLHIPERARLLDARVWAAGFGLGGAVWITTTFPIWLAMGANGRIDSRTIWFATLLPAAFCVIVSLFFRVREIRASYAKRIPDEEDRHRTQQARGWSHMYQRAGFELRPLDMGSRYRLFGTSAVLAIFLILIPFAMALFSMAFPLLVQDNASLYSTVVRSAGLAPLRSYAQPLDTADARRVFEPAFRQTAAATAQQARQDVQRGQRDSPEAVARGLVSAGFFLTDSARARGDLLTGLAVIQVGADALATVYRASGRATEAERISTVLANTAASSQSALSLARGSRTTRRGLEHVVLRPDMPRAIRWHAFSSATTLARCGSLSAMVFGVSKEQAAFERAAQDALVRNTEDQEYFTQLAGAKGCNFRLLRRAFFPR